MDREEPSLTYYRLEVAARLAGLSPSRLRRLEAQGLVRPARMVGTRRLFGEVEVARLRRIRRLTDDLGVNLAGVEVILRLVEDLAAARAALAEGSRRGGDGPSSQGAS